MSKLKVDFSNVIGRIKDVNGVNNCMPLWSPAYAKALQEWYREASITSVRLHDMGGTYGGGVYVDVNNIFRNMDADENDESAYDFEHTDICIKFIADTGAQVVYRLGPTIENAQERKTCAPKYIYPPKDNLKWAKVCEHIIAHYNEGWANGFNYGIKYWEIWNEPECRAMWTGTREQFIEMYVVASKYLKARFPDIKIGGYGSMGFYCLYRHDPPFDGEPYTGLVEYLEAFLAGVRDNKAPLDFFSWHLYSEDINEYVKYAEYARHYLTKYGFGDAETILGEWNLDGIFGHRPGIREAAGISAVLSTLQHLDLSIANYYSVSWLSVYNGLFGCDEMYKPAKLKGFYTFKVFGELYKLGNEIKIEKSDSPIYALGAFKDGTGELMLTNFEADDQEISIEVTGLRPGKYVAETRVLDEENDLYLIKTEYFSSEKFTLFNTVGKNSVYSIRICEEK